MPYPKQIDAASIGQTALQLVEAHGWQAFSLRRLSKALGVTPNALYRHVGDRQGLDIQIAAVAAAEIARWLRDESAGLESEALVLGLSDAYVRFASARADAYRAFLAGKPELDDPRLGAWLGPWRLIRRAVEPLVPLAAAAAGIALIALLHGRIDLARGPLRAAAPTDGLEGSVRALLVGFEKLGPVDGPTPQRGRVPS